MNPVDRAIAALAASQHGVVARRQLLRSGMTERMIDARVRQGDLRSEHPGVYLVAGAQPSWDQRQMAACLWSKGAAGVRAAGFLHGLPGFDDPPVEVVTTRNKRPMPRCGVVCHHTNRLPAEQLVRIRSILTTSIERTLLDLCGHVGHRRAAIALDQALHGAQTTLGSLDHCLYLTARRGRDGCGVLRNLIQERVDLSEFPNSPLETVIFELVRSAGLPLPELQKPIHDARGNFVARPDFVWPTEKLVIEGHSKLWHEGLIAKARDQQRHSDLAALGYRILYVTWADATTMASPTVRVIARALEAGSGHSDVVNPPWKVGQLAQNGLELVAF